VIKKIDALLFVGSGIWNGKIAGSGINNRGSATLQETRQLTAVNKLISEGLIDRLAICTLKDHSVKRAP
jgi:hypothetical protein